MLTKRLIACLDVRDGLVVKGVSFADLAPAGDPAALAARYDREGADEVVVLDVSATIEGRRARTATVGRIARELSIPLTVGGGIRSLDDARGMFEAGADKVAVNSAALEDPELISRLADVYGSQAVVVAIDARRNSGDRYEVWSRSGTANTERDAVDWAREAEARGAGEILLTSVDRDGTRAGFECVVTPRVSDAVGIPLIASGGAGDLSHFLEVFTIGRADAALAASIFHFSEHSIASLKRFLHVHGVPVRPVA